VSGPGDGAPKHPSLREPTQSDHAEGHGAGPNVGVDLSLSPGSWSSARLHMPHAREPGGLGGASPPWWAEGSRGKANSRKPRGHAPSSGLCSDGAYPEESDAGMVPEKSAKTRVTPVESMEGRAAAAGKPDPQTPRRTLCRKTWDQRVEKGRTASGGRDPRGITTLGLPSARCSVDPRWEPGAGNPLAGFCPGGGPKGPSLPGPKTPRRPAKPNPRREPQLSWPSVPVRE
jgi:hypothetical protein